MCMVSAIFESGRQIDYSLWSRPTLQEFLDLVEKVKELDRKLNQKDCEDPQKAIWIQEIKDRLDKLGV